MSKLKRIGIALHIALFAVCLVCNWFAASLPEVHDPAGFAFPVWITIGCMFAQLAMVSIWLGLSRESVFQRIGFYIAYCVPMLTSLVLGYLFAFSKNRNLYEWDPSELWAVMSIFLVMQVGMLIPVFVFRWAGFTLTDDPTGRSGAGFSIGAMLVATAFIAGFLVSAQNTEFPEPSPAGVGNQPGSTAPARNPFGRRRSNNLPVAGGGATTAEPGAIPLAVYIYSSIGGFCAVVSALFACPLVFFLYRKTFVKMLFVSIVFTLVLLIPVHLMIGNLRQGAGPLQIFYGSPMQVGLSSAFLVFLATMAWFALAMRCMGFQLVRGNKKKADADSNQSGD